MLLCCRCINLLFKNQCPLILWSHLFPKKYLKPQLSINKMVIENSVQYHPSPSRSTSRIILSYSYRTYTFVSEILTNFSPTIGKLFPTKCMVFRLLEYALLSHKTQKLVLLFTFYFLEVDIFTHPPHKQKSPPGSHHHSYAGGNYSFSTMQCYFENLFSPQQKERGKKICSLLYEKESRYNKSSL